MLISSVDGYLIRFYSEELQDEASQVKPENAPHKNCEEARFTRSLLALRAG